MTWQASTAANTWMAMRKSKWDLGLPRGACSSVLRPRKGLCLPPWKLLEPSAGGPTAPPTALVEQQLRQYVLSPRTSLPHNRESGISEEGAPWMDRKTEAQRREMWPGSPR